MDGWAKEDIVEIVCFEPLVSKRHMMAVWHIPFCVYNVEELFKERVS